MTQSDSIPAEWIQAAADAIRRACVGQYNAETPVAPNEEWRAIATAAITILRPLIEAETRERCATACIELGRDAYEGTKAERHYMACAAVIREGR